MECDYDCMNNCCEMRLRLKKRIEKLHKLGLDYHGNEYRELQKILGEKE